MPFVKGKSGNPSGRPKGAPNKDVEAMRQAWLDAFQALQLGKANLVEWATENPTDFYKLSKTLIPQEMITELDVTSGGEAIAINIVTKPKED